jgi:hypothetical protein
MHAHRHTETGTDAILHIMQQDAKLLLETSRVESFEKSPSEMKFVLTERFLTFMIAARLIRKFSLSFSLRLLCVTSFRIYPRKYVKFLKRRAKHALVVRKTISKPPAFTLILSIHQSYFDVSMRRLSYCLGSASSHTRTRTHAYKRTCATRARRYRNRARMHARVRDVHGI